MTNVKIKEIFTHLVTVS